MLKLYENLVNFKYSQMPPVYVEEVEVQSKGSKNTKTDEKQSQVTVQIEETLSCELPPYSEFGRSTNTLDEDAAELRRQQQAGFSQICDKFSRRRSPNLHWKCITISCRELFPRRGL